MAKNTKASEKKTVEVTSENLEVKNHPETEVELKTETIEQAEIKELKKQVNELQEQLAKALAVINTGNNEDKQQVNQKTERVQFLWQAEVADDNIVSFGEGGMYGRIVGKTGSFFVPKDELSRILDTTNRMFLNKRWLIVISGLDDEEREALGVNYKEGELLDEKMFRKITRLSSNELLNIYPSLCDSHKEIVAKRLHEAYLNGQHIERELIVALNQFKSTEAFKSIIEKMNAEDLS